LIPLGHQVIARDTNGEELPRTTLSTLGRDQQCGVLCLPGKLSTTPNKGGAAGDSAAVMVFAPGDWYEPRPSAKTVLQVSAVGGGWVYRVRCGRVMEWRTSVGAT